MTANIPEPPYFAVIFSSQRNAGDNGYEAMSERMLELAAQQPGYLGIESSRSADGAGITVSYWDSLEAIAAWKKQAEHQVAQSIGRSSWYSNYSVKIARVERSYKRAT